MKTVAKEVTHNYTPSLQLRRGLGAMVAGLGVLTACSPSHLPQQAEKPPVCTSLRVDVLDTAKRIVAVSTDYANSTPGTRVTDIAYIFDRNEGAEPYPADEVVEHTYPVLPEAGPHTITAIVEYEHDGAVFGSPDTCTSEVFFTSGLTPTSPPSAK